MTCIADKLTAFTFSKERSLDNCISKRLTVFVKGKNVLVKNHHVAQYIDCFVICASWELHYATVRAWELHYDTVRGHDNQQTAQTLMRRRIMRRLIWVYAVCQFIVSLCD